MHSLAGLAGRIGVEGAGDAILVRLLVPAQRNHDIRRFRAVQPALLQREGALHFLLCENHPGIIRALEKIDQLLCDSCVVAGHIEQETSADTDDQHVPVRGRGLEFIRRGKTRGIELRDKVGRLCHGRKTVVGNHDDIRLFQDAFGPQGCQDNIEIGIHAFDRAERDRGAGGRVVLREIGITHPEQREFRHPILPQGFRQCTGRPQVFVGIGKIHFSRKYHPERLRGIRDRGCGDRFPIINDGGFLRGVGYAFFRAIG